MFTVWTKTPEENRFSEAGSFDDRVVAETRMQWLQDQGCDCALTVSTAPEVEKPPADTTPGQGGNP